MKDRKWMKARKIFGKFDPRRTMNCMHPETIIKAGEMFTGKRATSECSSLADDGDKRSETINIEEAESCLREGGLLNYEEARALLGRLEYQRGNVEAALSVLSGIDITSITPKIKISISRRTMYRKSKSHWDAPPMSIHAVSLLMEALYIKARALQDLGKFKEAAQSCNMILDTVESTIPKGFPEYFRTECKLQDVVCKSVVLLPQLWKLADHPLEVISSYRRALLGQWSFNPMTIAKLRKEFAVFLLYGGCEASPPNLRYQMEGYFTPMNNVEEALLLLTILLSDFHERKLEWDSSIIQHITYALTVSGQLRPLANQFEELLPGVLHRNERYYLLALCYEGEGDSLTALNLLKKILGERGDPNCVKALLLASKICGNNNVDGEDGVSFSRRALTSLNGRCEAVGSTANYLLGVSLSAQSRSSIMDHERVSKQNEALEAFQKAERLMQVNDCRVIYHLSLENAELRKLDIALHYAKQLLKLEAGSNVKTWILVARILSAQKRFVDAENIICAALDQIGKWSHGELLQTKAKIQIAQSQLKEAVETYSNLLAVIQLWAKNHTVGMKCSKIDAENVKLEIEAWHDLAISYTSMSQWTNAEVCLSKLKAISPYSALRWHATGKFQEAKGFLKQAFESCKKALDLDPTHVPSLVSAGILLGRCGDQPFSVARSFLAEALRLDRTNHIAWFNLGLLYKAEGISTLEAAECFQAAALLEESAPVEPFQ
ncbi:putative UDP-N-acetylglucosamine--peptide N-acetylglucosaminyltransferase SEC [Apostasia shenzhenica]|uniref:Putative UDP-N-acetylglucosamine--peptide N-acetylglucosaminyltransferase SEC n=1 Tax=Apostasia shenzhenica TaxID=1088818 RepID=A0A2I0AF50_9ASPA|nr:putative UDP-N-acetylglucosamine--peptide N-acetylglucosaminyltransferase SEC [Apostasia shenzhenica]